MTLKATVSVAHDRSTGQLPRPIPEPKYLGYADGMRVIAVAAVALLHASATGVVRYDSLASRQWWIANAIDASCRWAVPVFLMLSGALALDPARRGSLSAFYSRRLIRVGIPLVAWTAFYFLWTALYHEQQVTVESVRGSLRAGLVETHLYFLFVILGLYAVAPLLREAIIRTSPSVGWALAALLMVLASCGIPQEYWRANAVTLFLPYVGYFVMGFLLRDVSLTPRRLAVAAAAFTLACVVITIGTGMRFARWGPSDYRSLALYEYTGAAVVAQSVAAFLLIQRLCSPRTVGGAPNRWIRLMGGAAFGIYLVHRATLDVVAGWTGDLYAKAAGAAIALHALLAFLGALLVTLLIQRVPYIRRVVG
jgi:surface polysaccharide O-acyltransferase-like enzyme